VIELVPLPVPQRVGAPGWSDFVAGIEIRNAVESHAYGTSDLQHDAAEQLPHYQNPTSPQRMILARDRGAWVGRARYELESTGDTAWVNVEVLVGHRGLGIGRALADEVESTVLGTGRRKAIAYVPIGRRPGPRLAAPTGAGSVPAQSRDVGFLLARGYRLEQVERASRLVLPVRGLASRLAEATRRSGSGYVAHSWVGPTPGRWCEELAGLRTRLSTDVPTAGLEEPPVAWTAEDVREDDAKLGDHPRPRLMTVIEHRRSGELVAFTELSLPIRPGRAGSQGPTLVKREHRGHGLGLLAKLTNLEQLELLAPEAPSITTVNAEENQHMLAVNTELGYAPLAHQSGWRKDFTS
jgi:GNAT superfamily N-acetyltransferase